VHIIAKIALLKCKLYFIRFCLYLLVVELTNNSINKNRSKSYIYCGFPIFD